jgi:hypothetical protein
MRGNVKLKRINKKTGETDILFEDSNQTTTGFGHTIVNILTGQGSRNLEDYQVGYFQLGSEAFDLDPSGGFDDFGMSADVGVSANVPFFWTLKSLVLLLRRCLVTSYNHQRLLRHFTITLTGSTCSHQELPQEGQMGLVFSLLVVQMLGRVQKVTVIKESILCITNFYH